MRVPVRVAALGQRRPAAHDVRPTRLVGRTGAVVLAGRRRWRVRRLRATGRTRRAAAVVGSSGRVARRCARIRWWAGARSRVAMRGGRAVVEACLVNRRRRTDVSDRVHRVADGGRRLGDPAERRRDSQRGKRGRDRDRCTRRGLRARVLAPYTIRQPRRELLRRRGTCSLQFSTHINALEVPVCHVVPLCSSCSTSNTAFTGPNLTTDFTHAAASRGQACAGAKIAASPPSVPARLRRRACSSPG
jgi:hypothetical protein